MCNNKRGKVSNLEGMYVVVLNKDGQDRYLNCDMKWSKSLDGAICSADFTSLSNYSKKFGVRLVQVSKTMIIDEMQRLFALSKR